MPSFLHDQMILWTLRKSKRNIWKWNSQPANYVFYMLLQYVCLPIYLYFMFVFQSTYIFLFVFQSTHIFCSSSNLLIFFVRLPMFSYLLCWPLLSVPNYMQISLCAHFSAICMPAWQPSKSIRNGTTTKFVCVREITLIYGHLCAEHSQSIIEYSYVRKCLRSYSRSPHSILQANNCSGWSVLSQMSQLKLV